MNTKELDSFLQVCQDQSIAKAAKALFITPQGLSKIIKNLETELQAELFYRTPNGIHLTEYGRVLQKQAAHIRDELAAVEAEIERLRHCSYGQLKIASAYGILSALSLDMLLAFQKANPGMVVNIKEYTDRAAEEMVWQNQADAGLTIGPVDDSHFDCRLIKSYQLLLLAHSSHPLARHKTVSTAQLKGEPLILESQEFKLYHNVAQRCRQAGFSPNIIFETTEISFAHKLCHLNKGLSVTVDYVARDLFFDNVVAIPFDDDSWRWDICLITKKHQACSHSSRLFEDFLVRWVAEHPEPISSL